MRKWIDKKAVPKNLERLVDEMVEVLNGGLRGKNWEGDLRAFSRQKGKIVEVEVRFFVAGVN